MCCVYFLVMVWTFIYNLSPIVPSRNSAKTAQTTDRPSSLDFPTPPPAITDANGYSEQAPDEYLSLKVQRSNCTLLYLLIHTSSSLIVTHASLSQTIYVERSVTKRTDGQKQKTGI